MAPVRALLAILVVTLGSSSAHAANILGQKPTRTEHLLYRGGGTGTTTTRYLHHGSLTVTRDQLPGKSRLEVVIQVPTGPFHMKRMTARAEGPAGQQAHLPRAQQRQIDALVRELGAYEVR